jgi:hypothetical protein
MTSRRDKVKEEVAPYAAAPVADDWVHELIAMTRPGIDFRLPDRMPWERQVPFEFDDFS